MTGSLAWLAAAAFFFVAIHIVPSSVLRAQLVGAIGEGAYRGLFSALSAAGLGWLIWAYAEAPAGGAVYWDLGAVGRYIALVLVALAWILLVATFTTRNPTTRVAKEGAQTDPNTQGIVRVTRHPLFWGLALWGIAHLINNGDPASIILFASLTLLALVGGVLIDLKKKNAFGADWARVAAVNSNLPFAGILAGRNRFVLGEIGWWRVGLGLALYALFLHLHVWLFGANPLPW